MVTTIGVWFGVTLTTTTNRSMCSSRKAITYRPHLHHHIRRTHCNGRPRAMLFCRCYNPASTLAVVVVTAALLASSTDTLSNVPQTLSGDDPGGPTRIQRPKSRRAESCTVKCVTTCIRGGAGSPGEGPLNARRPLVVFKQGFRSRQYCLVECSDICNLIRDGDDGP